MDPSRPTMPGGGRGGGQSQKDLNEPKDPRLSYFRDNIQDPHELDDYDPSEYYYQRDKAAAANAGGSAPNYVPGMPHMNAFYGAPPGQAGGFMSPGPHTMPPASMANRQGMTVQGGAQGPGMPPQGSNMMHGGPPNQFPGAAVVRGFMNAPGGAGGAGGGPVPGPGGPQYGIQPNPNMSRAQPATQGQQNQPPQQQPLTQPQPQPQAQQQQQLSLAISGNAQNTPRGITDGSGGMHPAVGVGVSVSQGQRQGQGQRGVSDYRLSGIVGGVSAGAPGSPISQSTPSQQQRGLPASYSAATIKSNASTSTNVIASANATASAPSTAAHGHSHIHTPSTSTSTSIPTSSSSVSAASAPTSSTSQAPMPAPATVAVPNVPVSVSMPSVGVGSSASSSSASVSASASVPASSSTSALPSVPTTTPAGVVMSSGSGQPASSAFDPSDFPVLNGGSGSDRFGGSLVDHKPSVEFSIHNEADFPALGGEDGGMGPGPGQVQGGTGTGSTGGAVKQAIQNANANPNANANANAPGFPQGQGPVPGMQGASGSGIVGAMTGRGIAYQGQANQGAGGSGAGAGGDVPQGQWQKPFARQSLSSAAGSSSMAQSRQSESENDSHSSGVSGLARDQYGLLGLLDVIRRSDSDHTTLALGTDLTTLGLNLNSPELLYESFSSPWADGPVRRDPDYTLPACYYLQPPLAPPMNKLPFVTDETLFYIFYAMPMEALQMASAKELCSRDWRYHKELKLWFQRIPDVEPQKKGNVERGSYVYFDLNSWERVQKDNLTLAIDQLLDSESLSANKQ